MRQNIKSFALVTFIVALILFISIIAVMIEQGFKVEKAYYQDNKTSEQVSTAFV